MSLASVLEQVRVVQVADGDTIVVLSKDNEQIKVRLFGIDAPEKSQDFGKKAQKYLASLVSGKYIDIHVKDKDQYGRTVAVIKHANQDLNALVVASGYAWAYRTYSNDYVRFEDEARANKSGLWQQSKPVAPWEWRKQQREIKNINKQEAETQESEGWLKIILKWFGF